MIFLSSYVAKYELLFNSIIMTRCVFSPIVNFLKLLKLCHSLSLHPTKLNRLLVFRNCARHGMIWSGSSSLALCKLSVDALMGVLWLLFGLIVVLF